VDKYYHKPIYFYLIGSKAKMISTHILVLLLLCSCYITIITSRIRCYDYCQITLWSIWDLNCNGMCAMCSWHSKASIHLTDGLNSLYSRTSIHSKKPQRSFFRWVSKLLLQVQCIIMYSYVYASVVMNHPCKYGLNTRAGRLLGKDRNDTTGVILVILMHT